VAHRLGAPLTLAIGGAACIVGSAVFSMQLPALRVEARKLILAQEMISDAPITSTPLISDADVGVMEAALVPPSVAVPEADSGDELTN
jgi:hypothetical protein